MATFKKGQKVAWKSHAGGIWQKKTGTIVEVCRDKKVNLTQQTKVNILREVEETTIAKAKETARYINAHVLLGRKYTLKFNPFEGYREDTPHYLVEVDRGEGHKPFLYHPLTKNLQPAK